MRTRRGITAAHRIDEADRWTEDEMPLVRPERLAMVALAVVFAACTSPAASAGVATAAPTAVTASALPGATGAGPLGIPAVIGEWRLVATVRTMDPDTAAVITAAGGDPSTAIDVDVRVSGPTGPLNFDVLQVPGVSFDSLIRAAEPFLAGAGLTERSVVQMAGRTVMRYARPAVASGPSHVVFWTGRGDLIYATGYMEDAQFAALLVGLP
jgi:hypothetical protein